MGVSSVRFFDSQQPTTIGKATVLGTGTASFPRRNPVSEQTAKCIQISDKSLLRGSRASLLLRGGGRIFHSSEGSAATFEMSEPVLQLDAFISHNWSTPSRKKFAALALHFNFLPGLAAAVVTMLIIVSLMLVGMVPTHEAAWGDHRFQSSFACHAACSIMFLLTILCRHELYIRGRSSSPIVFLDKTCIHQTDAHRKQVGIESLGAFLHMSKSMIIIYSDTYLRKLWTVYELASSLMIHPDGEIVVIPIGLPMLLLRGFIFWTAFTTVHKTFELQSFAILLGPEYLGMVQLVVTVVMLVAGSLYMAWMQVGWARQVSCINDVVHNFEFARADCFKEEDRQVVQGNIECFMKDLELVEADADEATVINSFDQLVRREVSNAIKMSLGRGGIPYKYAVAMFLSQSLRLGDTAVNYPQSDVLESLLSISLHLSLTLFVLPLTVAFPYHISFALLLHLKRRWAFTAGFMTLYTLLGIFGTGAWVVLDVLKNSARSSTLSIVLYASLIAVLCALTCLVYRPLPRQQVQRHGLRDLMMAQLEAISRSVSSRFQARSTGSSSVPASVGEGSASPKVEPSKEF